ncbi:MAG: TetR/AcrR family transcriptional regulator [Caulobacteraceae bacterium]
MARAQFPPAVAGPSIAPHAPRGASLPACRCVTLEKLRTAIPPRRASIGAVRSPETKAAILKAAGEILDEVGYCGFTIDAVVKRAGSSKPTIYRWWRNKGSLIMEVYERAGEATLATPDTGTLEGDLADYLRALWTWLNNTRSGEALRSFVTEAQLDPISIKELREGFLPRRERPIRVIFERAASRGEIVDHPAAVNAAVGLIIGWSWLNLLTDDLGKLEQVEAGVRLVARGLLAD